MIFAAGYGTRMGRLTRNRPKPLIEVCGRSLLTRALDVAACAACAPIIVNAHYHAQQIVDFLKPHNIPVSVEEPDILDTGGGLRAALHLLRASTVFTLNSDAVWTGPNPLNTLRHAWDPERMDALLLMVPHDRATGRMAPGDFTLAADGQLRRGGDMVYVGAQILKTGSLHDIPDRAFSLNRIWDGIAQRGRLYGALHSGGWCDVGHPEGIGLAEEMLRQGTNG